MSDWRKNTDEALRNLVKSFKGKSDRKLLYQMALTVRDAIEGHGEPIRNMEEMLDCIDGRSQKLAERCYRRGYVHGYSIAIDDAFEGNKKDKRRRMCDFLDLELMEWRLSRFNDDDYIMEPPPQMNRK